MQKIIYFNQNPLILTDEAISPLQELTNPNTSYVINNLGETEVEDLISHLQSNQLASGIIVHKNINESFKAVANHFTIIQAAGGLVYTPEKEVLFIFRRGKWDLPKGKLEKGEALEDCAVREVEEETGLDNLQLEKLLCTTYHTYREGDTPVLKESYWYAMFSKEKKALTPQLEEDIQKCEWVPVASTGSYLQNTHTSIKDVVAAGLNYLQNRKG